ncbi:MAG TPA: hypothetical protein VLK85_31125 [Ramlibacter sp.]|nr:hypothetical protein [Ramlibacter sp.]
MTRTALASLLRASALALAALSLGGCTVIAIADTAASLAIGGAGLAVDAAVGTVKLTGKAVGAAAGAVLPGGDE